MPSAGANKMAVVTAIREATGLGVVEAKALVDSAPKCVKEKVSKVDANEIKSKLEKDGASVEYK